MVIYSLKFLNGVHVFDSYACSFTVHTGAGLIIPELQDDGQVYFNYAQLDMLMWLNKSRCFRSLYYLIYESFPNLQSISVSIVRICDIHFTFLPFIFSRFKLCS